MTPSPETIRRNAAAISARRAMMAASGVGMRMGLLPLDRGTAGGTDRSQPASCWPRGPAAPTKNRALQGAVRRTAIPGLSALARLVAGVGLVDHVDAALAAHDAAVLVALLERFQGIGDF